MDVTPASVFAQLSEEERVTCRLLVASEDEDWTLLMDLMRKYERYFKVQLEGAKALWFHSNPAQMGGVGGEQVAAKQETLRQAGGPQALVRAGNRFYREVTLVQPWLVGALVHLAEGSARVQNFLINAGAIQLLLKLMKRHPHHEKIVDVSCTCLRMVIGTAIVNVQFARNLGLGRALVKALHDHPHPIETAWQDRSARPMLRTMKINIRKAMKRFRKELKAKEKRKQELREAAEDEDSFE